MGKRDEFELATERGRRMMADPSGAVAARYDRATGRVVVRLRSNLEISFSPQDAQGVEDATPAQLKDIEVSPSGQGIHVPRLEADFYIPGLLEGIMGSPKWTAARLGRAGGRVSSPAKKAASRANGRLGGRPKRAARR